MAPSPTAEATRLIDPLLTSPAANTPGQLVSSSSGGWWPVTGRTLAGAERTASAPVRMKPRSSSARWVSQPARVGLGADEDEERPHLERVALTGPVVLDHECLKRSIADQLAHLGVAHDLHVCTPLDLVSQVARHALPKVAIADQQADLCGVLRQEHRRLPRRVAATNDRHRGSVAQQRLHQGCGVVDALALELLEAGWTSPVTADRFVNTERMYIPGPGRHGQRG